MSPLGLGLKFALVEENGLIPDIAFISSWNVPNTGHEFYASDRWHHSYVFALAHTLTERWGLGYNLGYEFEGNFEHSSFKYSLVGGYSVAEKLGTFIEIYGSKASGVNLDLRYDMGLTYLLFDNFQLDLSGGIGLTDISPDGFISAGFSWRIPR